MSRPEEFCCAECFNHPWLKAQAAANEVARGQCFYCGTDNALSQLNVFESGLKNLLRDYIPAADANGGGDAVYASMPILEAVQRDWEIFSSKCDEARLKSFLPTLLKDSEDSTTAILSVPVVAFHRNAMSTAFDRWREFLSMDPRNFYDLSAIDVTVEIETPGTFPNQHATHLQDVIHVFPAGRHLWRARADYIGTSEWNCQPLPLSAMGHNPKCPSSRLNRSGEVVLYTAEAQQTALAEIRPGRNYICTTAELKTTRPVTVLDLASPNEEINPFTDDQLSWHLDLRRITVNLSAQVAQPISRGEDPLIYSKTQYLASLTRAMKLDGIRFSSSLDVPNGVNLALFATDSVRFESNGIALITESKIAYRTLAATM